MFLNFLTIKIVEARVVEDPVELTKKYLSFSFWPDLISVVPWPLFLPSFTFLRLIKMTKLSDY